MVIHSVVEFEFCFSHILLFTFTAVGEVTYVLRLPDGVCFTVMMTGYGCGEMSFLSSDSTSWDRFTWPESRCCWFAGLFLCFDDLSISRPLSFFS